MTVDGTPFMPIRDPIDAMVIEFARAALQGALSDPACNPASQERMNEVCDFCWHIAHTMVARKPQLSEPTQ